MKRRIFRNWNAQPIWYRYVMVFMWGMLFATIILALGEIISHD